MKGRGNDPQEEMLPHIQKFRSIVYYCHSQKVEEFIYEENTAACLCTALTEHEFKV